jgi:predicted metalloprotease
MPSRESRARAHRRVIRRRRQVVGGGLLLLVALLVLAGVRLAAALTGDTVATAASRSGTPITTPRPREGSASTPSAPSADPTGVRATGEYTRATGGTDLQGSGTLRTYRVEVETGTGQDVQAFAAAVDATLADPASWAGSGRWSVQRVAGEDADLVIRLATSATVGTVCAAAGLEDASYSSCRTGRFVMINLDRWLHAVPEYQGDVALYRQYVINHEVGHGLGLGHQVCPGPGRPAPVMQQQTLGLNGCLPNGWPYIDGVLVSGPAAT